MPEKKFELGDYVEVKDRIKLFYELYAGGSIVTEEVTLTTEPDGKPRVMVRAAAYRNAEDPHPGIGYSWLELPGRTPYTNGSEVENAETSAWGRAIASLGILVDRSIASAQEVQNKAGDAPERPVAAQKPPAEPLARDDGSLVGTAEIGKGQADFELRQTPDGMKVEFRLTSGRGGIKVVAIGPLAEALAAVKSEVIGKRVTCWGKVSDQTFRPKGSTKDVTYQVLTLSRIQTPDMVLPADLDRPPGEPAATEDAASYPDVEQPPDDIPLFAENPAA